jgi:hypothetical protein
MNYNYEIRSAPNATRPEDRGELLAYAETWAEAVAKRDAHEGSYISRIQPVSVQQFNAEMWAA